jgi:hypothetical protein
MSPVPGITLTDVITIIVIMPLAGITIRPVRIIIDIINALRTIGHVSGPSGPLIL